jgi:hypothetical protein
MTLQDKQLPSSRRKFLTSSPRLPAVKGMKLTVSEATKGYKPLSQNQACMK